MRNSEVPNFNNFVKHTIHTLCVSTHKDIFFFDLQEKIKIKCCELYIFCGIFKTAVTIYEYFFGTEKINK